MKLRLIFAGAMFALQATSAFAAGPYVIATGGVSYFHDAEIEVIGVSPQFSLGSADISYDLGYGFTFGAGYNFDGFRLEGEWALRRTSVDKISAHGNNAPLRKVDDFTVVSYMVNGYYDVKTSSGVSPFFGVGIGQLNGDLDVIGYDIEDNTSGYQLTAGVTYPINKSLSLALSYRLQGAFVDIESNYGDLSYLNSSIMAGVRYDF